MNDERFKSYIPLDTMFHFLKYLDGKAIFESENASVVMKPAVDFGLVEPFECISKWFAIKVGGMCCRKENCDFGYTASIYLKRRQNVHEIGDKVLLYGWNGTVIGEEYGIYTPLVIGGVPDYYPNKDICFPTFQPKEMVEIFSNDEWMDAYFIKYEHDRYTMWVILMLDTIEVIRDHIRSVWHKNQPTYTNHVVICTAPDKTCLAYWECGCWNLANNVKLTASCVSKWRKIYGGI